MRRIPFLLLAFVTTLALQGCGDSTKECLSGSTKCGGTCVVLSEDNLNCGACGTACTAGDVCSAGVCALTCEPGRTDCSGSCRDTETDFSNCGACGTICAAGQVCSAGLCELSCQSGLTDCGGSCRDTASDEANCGACGTTCTTGQSCNAGVCELSCQAGLTDCGGTCSDTQSDLDNCGACGTVCAAGQVCSAGVCAATCQAGLADCSGSCRATSIDPANCGACGTVCAAGQVCSAGVCGLVCSGGTTKCGASCVDTQSSPANCGACGTVCAAGNACVSGTCQPFTFTFSGIKTNLPIASLGGWTLCYLAPYTDSTTTLAAIQAACSQANLLMGCRTAGSSTLLVAANAPRADVLFNTGSSNTPHNANGVGWYYGTSVSWGFAPQGSVINRSSCDVIDSNTYPGGGATDGAQRICWHTGATAIGTGWRCGKADFLGATHERVIYQRP